MNGEQPQKNLHVLYMLRSWRLSADLWGKKELTSKWEPVVFLGFILGLPPGFALDPEVCRRGIFPCGASACPAICG